MARPSSRGTDEAFPHPHPRRSSSSVTAAVRSLGGKENDGNVANGRRAAVVRKERDGGRASSSRADDGGDRKYRARGARETAVERLEKSPQAKGRRGKDGAATKAMGENMRSLMNGTWSPSMKASRSRKAAATREQTDGRKSDQSERGGDRREGDGVGGAKKATIEAPSSSGRRRSRSGSPKRRRRQLSTDEPAPASTSAAAELLAARPSKRAKTKTKRITREAKVALCRCFSELNWPLDRNLPRSGEDYPSELKRVVDEFGLARAQIVRQLRNYKDEKRGRSDDDTTCPLPHPSLRSAEVVAESPTLDVAGRNARDARDGLRRALRSLLLGDDSSLAGAVRALAESPALINATASASFALGEGGEGSPLVLDREVVKGQSTLLEATKGCLESLSSSSASESGNSRSIAPLRVAVHCLRAVVPTLPERISSKHGDLARLLTNCTVYADRSSRKHCDALADAVSLSSSSGEADARAATECSSICLGAYEGLGRVLGCRAGTATGMRSKEKKRDNEKAGVRWEDVLPSLDPGVALQAEDQDLDQGIVLPYKQRTEISTKASCCATLCLLRLTLISLCTRAPGYVGGRWYVPNEFHFVPEVVREACNGECDGKPGFRTLLMTTTLPCVVAYTSHDDGGESDAIDPKALSEINAVSSDFFQVARLIKVFGGGAEAEVLALNEFCLGLRQDGILFVLRALDEIARQWPRVASSLQELFDKASSRALRTARTYATGLRAINGEVADEDKDDASRGLGRSLLWFHNDVGEALDATAWRLYQRQSGSMNAKDWTGGSPSPPASYYEYNAYRAIQRWRLLGPTGAGVYPVYEAGEVPDEDAEVAAARSTLMVVHLVLRARTASISLSDSFLERVKTVVSHFEDVVVSASSDVLAPAVRSRCRSLLVALHLPRDASRTMRSPPSIGSASNATEEGEEGEQKRSRLFALASILARCFAPLEPSPTDRANFMVKAAILYEEASAVDKANVCLREAYAALVGEMGRRPRAGLDREAPEVVVAESFARTAWYIGGGTNDADTMQMLSSFLGVT